MDLKRIFLIAILIIAFALAVFFIFSKTSLEKETVNGRGIDSGGEVPQENPGEKNTNSNGNLANGNSAQSGAGSSGSSGGSSGSGSTGNGCYNQQISYGLTGFNEEANCEIFSGEICIRKKVSCSLTVGNLDHENSGVFNLHFIVFDKAIGESFVISEKNVSLIIEPLNSQVFSEEFFIEGENANKELSCKAYSFDVPEIEIC